MISKEVTLRSLLTTVLMILFIGTSLAQNQEDIVTKVKSSISAGDADQVAGYFDSSIDLSLPGIDGTYSSKQAQVILKEFFRNNPAASFAIQHKGNSNDGSHYVIGKYSSNSKNYRTYFLLKKRNNRYTIQQLQFEEE